MKKVLLALISLSFLIGCSSNENEANPSNEQEQPTQSQATKATYKVEVTFAWSQSNFPMNYPSGDHFSPLIGWVHNSTTTFFDENTTASAGIKTMAETGGTSTLKSEIESKIQAGEGLKVVTGSGLGSGTGTVTVEIEVTKENPLVTLSTMIAPSPDWYVALVDANLYENGKFLDQKTFEAFPYDAGTDSGTNYTSANLATNPQGKITKITGAPFNTGKTIATVKFTKQ